MKISITGHCNGIGAALTAKLEENNHDVLGFDIINGFNIDLKNDCKRIVDLAIESDVFINNVFHPTGQMLLLKHLMAKWHNQNKLILNIGTSLLYEDVDSSNIDDPVWQEYHRSKLSQNNLIKSYNKATFLNRQLPRIIQINPGYTQTNLLSKMNVTEKYLTNIGVMTASEVADTVIHILDMYFNNNIFVKELFFEKI
jgi:nucleoside-diphosphate-sugar epimerase